MKDTVKTFSKAWEETQSEEAQREHSTDSPALAEEEKHALAFREMLPVALAAMMRASTDLSFVKDKNLTYMCCSLAFAKMVGLDNETEIVGKTDYDLFDRELAEKYRADDFRLMEEGRSLVDYLESIPSEDGVTHYSSTSKYLLYDAQGGIVGIYGTGRDITENLTANARLKLFIDSPPCGIAMFELRPKSTRTLYFSEGFYSYSGYSKAEYERRVRENPGFLFFKEDLPDFVKAINAIKRDGTPIDCYYRCHAKDNGYRWFNLRGTVTERRGDAVIVNAVQFDVTQQKEAEEVLRIHEEELTLAMSHIGRLICEYDPVLRTLTVPEAYAMRYALPTVLENVPFSVQQSDIVDASSRASYDAFFEAILRGDAHGSLDACVHWANGERHWEHADFSSVFDAAGRPIKAIIAIEDTTEQHVKFELEQNRPTMAEGNLLVHALFNLSTGETLEYAYHDGSEVPLAQRTVFTDDAGSLDFLIPNEMERERYRSLNTASFLLKRFAEGATELTVDYRRRVPDGEVVWVRNILHLLRDPVGSDILLFEYCYCIEDEKMQELMYQSLAGDGYDYVARINVKNQHYVLYGRDAQGSALPPTSGCDVDEAARRLAEENSVPEDREQAIKNTSVAGLTRNLENADRFQFTCRVLDTDGAVRYKKYTAYYLDRPRGIVVLTREDVSAVVQEERKKNEMLAGALEAANQASRAKTQFLSRMSHELRTPMNAIIGLSALAANDVGNPAAMEDAIGKIGISARYLLSLINDILEMSRIESGRVTLAEEPFDFEQFISGVNTIIFGQATGKGVDYDAVVNSFMEPIYVGDATKLQQILINVLGNAVKFTRPGGKITFAMEQLQCANGRATLRFVVSDTGMGIDKEYLPHLFEPFSQESASLTSTATGTGLGLAITKNLVDMMDGQIFVQSVKNVGSVFTIDVQLGIPEGSQQYMDLIASMNLGKMKTLVVDDDVIVCRSTTNILSSMGMEAEWVDSGARAVERVKEQHKAKPDFDTIFIDWKMPDMDGIETTRQIRKIVGPEVTIIIITAYDWQSIETQAMAAGADLFMEKPLFQSSIVKAFERVFRTSAAKIAARQPAKFDFSGRRILLAEDHPLNVEVAKRLLEKIGAEVQVAGNGLEALELFATSVDGYYDAILMDIRMPVMDGLAATKNIRNLRKKDGKSIPIIAMTANAFDEDVELSLSSGMDAHLAKPVDPQTLFSTLKRLMN